MNLKFLTLVTLLASLFSVNTMALTIEEQHMFDLINQYRVDNGFTVLQHDSHLQAASNRHADDMAANGFFSHNGSDGSTYQDRALDAGYTIDFLNGDFHIPLIAVNTINDGLGGANDSFLGLTSDPLNAPHLLDQIFLAGSMWTPWTWNHLAVAHASAFGGYLSGTATNNYWVISLGSQTTSPTSVTSPAVIWLFGTGLIALAGFRKHHKTQS